MSHRWVGRVFFSAMALGLVVAVSPLAAAGKTSSFPAAPTDPLFEKQWGLEKISAPKAWKLSDGRGTVIAIVDSGVDLKHPDLASKLIVPEGADFVDPADTDGPQDEHYHGTHVAGIAAAITNNGKGVAGTAPAAKIMPVRVLNEDGAGTTQQIADGIRFAAEHGADVINLSLGFDPGVGQAFSITGLLRPIKEAITYAWNEGAVIVAAAGNSSFPLCGEPAASTYVVCVGALRPDDSLALYSNFDATSMENYLVAPGGEGGCDSMILSTLLITGEPSSCSTGGGYGYASGTSMAAPFVSGVAALLAAQGLDNAEIVERLTATADDLGADGFDPMFGYGRVNALNAVRGTDTG